MLESQMSANDICVTQMKKVTNCNRSYIMVLGDHSKLWMVSQTWNDLECKFYMITLIFFKLFSKYECWILYVYNFIQKKIFKTKVVYIIFKGN